jgi:hypothetical protein
MLEDGDIDGVSQNRSKIWQTKAQSELREFKFELSKQSFERSYNWLFNSDSSNNSDFTISNLLKVKNSINELLPGLRTYTISSWWWTELIVGLVAKKQLSLDKAVLKLDYKDEGELDINLTLTLAKTEFLKGVTLLDKLDVRDNLMNCYWTSPKIVKFNNFVKMEDSELTKVISYFNSSLSLLNSLLPKSYLTIEFHQLREISLILAKLKFILELLAHNNENDTVELVTKLTLSKGIWFSRTKLELKLNPLQTLRSSQNWPNLKDLSELKPNIDNQKLNQYEINNVIDKYSKIYDRSGEDIWADISDLLPNKWAICTLDYCRESNDLIISRFDAYSGLTACRLPLVQYSNVPKSYTSNSPSSEIPGYPYDTVITELNQIINESVKISKQGQYIKTSQEKVNWWNVRIELDQRLKELLNNVEQRWLGVFKGFLKTDLTPISHGELKKLCNSVKEMIYEGLIKEKLGNSIEFEIDEGLILSLVRIGSQVTLDDSSDFLSLIVDTIVMNTGVDLNLTDSLQSQLSQKLFDLIQKAQSSENDNGRKIDHVILILDNYLGQLPWENLPCLKNSSVSRLPSLPLLRDLLTQLKEESQRNGIDHKLSRGFRISCEKTYYMLNPSSDLIRTQNYFSEALQASARVLGWRGTIGKPPTALELSNNLQKSDLYLYFGHGTGELYIRSEKVQQLDPAPLAILLGCSSGKIKFLGEIESFGTPLHYLLSNSKSVVANLWDVTDRDIDKFSHKFLALWGLENFRSLPDVEGNNVIKGVNINRKYSLAEALSSSRDNCVLKYLNGAAPVMYGLPVSLDD